MSIAAGIAAIIIVLIVIVAVGNFFIWLAEEPAGGKLVAAVGVIVFIAGIANAAAAAVIVGIVLFLAGIGFRSHAKETKREEKETIREESEKSFLRWRLTRLDEILDECWKQETREFNWERWWKDSDEIFYDDETETEREMKKRVCEEFRRMGRDQVWLLNMYLQWLKDDNMREAGIRQLKARKPMIQDLISLFATYSDQDAKAYCELVVRYRSDLYDYIIFARKQLTRQILQDMIDRGNAICK